MKISAGMKVALPLFLKTVFVLRGVADVVEMDPVLVTARGYHVAASRTPGGLAVLSGDELERRPIISISDAARLVPGMNRVGDSAWGADVNIRGLSRDSVVLLVDGCHLLTGNDINARFGMLPPSAIERVEILKGPVSALYGSGSIGGVVNVITRGRGFGPPGGSGEGGIDLDLGSNPEGFGAGARYGWRDEQLYLYAEGRYRDYDEYEDGAGRRVADTQYEDMYQALKIGWRVSASRTLEMQLQNYEGNEIGIPGSGTAPLPAVARVTYPSVRRRLLQLVDTYNPEGRTWEMSQLNLYYQANDRRVRIDDFPASMPVKELRPGADHRTAGLRWINRLRFGDHLLAVGTDLWRREMDSFRKRIFRDGRVALEKPLPDSVYGSAGLFLEDSWDISSALSVNAGGRVDAIRVENDEHPQWPEETVNETSWNLHLGAAWLLSEDLRLKGVMARGYRAAALEERFKYLDLGGGQVVLGDPELDPEESLFAEAGLEWGDGRLQAGFSAFFNRLDNMIAEQRLDAGTNVMANVKEAEIYGLELETRWLAVPGWTLYGNLAWAMGRDRRAGDDLPGMAPLNGLAGVSYEGASGFWAYTEMQAAARQDAVPAGTDTAPGWQTVHARVGYNYRRGSVSHRFFAGVDNLMDETYRNYLTTWRGAHFNEPGRSFNMGYQLDF